MSREPLWTKLGEIEAKINKNAEVIAELERSQRITKRLEEQLVAEVEKNVELEEKLASAEDKNREKDATNKQLRKKIQQLDKKLESTKPRAKRRKVKTFHFRDYSFNDSINSINITRLSKMQFPIWSKPRVGITKTTANDVAIITATESIIINTVSFWLSNISQI